MTQLPNREMTFPLPTRWERSEYGGYNADKVPTIRQVVISLPGDFDAADVDRIADVLRTCVDKNET